mmetsp:Transcript_26264/g.73674  ORF Transcript_26264/g.73674 Transcript_26264/m.73674 type:complete len:240 (-) Transcript_26264:60-779(-)
MPAAEHLVNHGYVALKACDVEGCPAIRVADAGVGCLIIEQLFNSKCIVGRRCIQQIRLPASHASLAVVATAWCGGRPRSEHPTSVPSVLREARERPRLAMATLELHCLCSRRCPTSYMIPCGLGLLLAAPRVVRTPSRPPFSHPESWEGGGGMPSASRLWRGFRPLTQVPGPARRLYGSLGFCRLRFVNGVPLSGRSAVHDRPAMQYCGFSTQNCGLREGSSTETASGSSTIAAIGVYA